jgi:lipopolysaccharide transport protein LptA
LEHKPGGADSGKGEASRTPSLLAGDQPVTITSNRLTYDGAASRGTFSGSARLTQEATEIRGDTIALDDESGNLTANGSVTTRMALQDTDPKTGQQKAVPTVGSGETFAYDDAKRVAVYTSSATAQAHIQGAFGDVTGDRIELYLKTAARELERAEADGHVTTIESNRTARGKHLTYTASDETYVMTGSPVDVLQRETSSCKRTLASTLRVRRAVDNIETTGNPVTTTTVPCPATAR